MFVLVALPNKNTPTNSLTFAYVLENVEETDWYRKLYVQYFTGEDGRKLLAIVGACIAVLICILVCGICICSYYCCCRPKVIEDPDNPGRRISIRRSTRGNSFRASMRRSMRLESFVNRSNQSFRRISTKKSVPSLMDQTLPRPAKIINLNDLNDEEQ